MKKIFFCSLFTFFLHLVYGQTYHVTYYEKQLFDIDAPGLASLSQDMKIKTKELFDNLVNVYRLENKNGRSKFYFDYALVKGEIDRDPRRYVNQKIVFKNFLEGNYYTEWLGEENPESPELKVLNTGWEIDKSRDTIIAGFDCQYAVLEKEKIGAWFAPAIPLMDGPFKYAGLPGLILRLEAKNHIVEIHDIKLDGVKINNH